MFRVRSSFVLASAAAATGSTNNSNHLAFVKELRARTEAPLTEVMSAMKECGQDFDKCIEWLKKRGAARVVKKSTRDARQGLLVCSHKPFGYILEANCETDFAARSPNFVALVQKAQSVLLSRGQSATVDDIRSELSGDITHVGSTLGERIELAKMIILPTVNDVYYGSYVHTFGANVPSGFGTLAALVGLQSPAKNDEEGKKVEVAACSLARHMAATKGAYLNVPLMKQNFMGDEISVSDWVVKAAGEGTLVKTDVLFKCGEENP